MTIVNPEAFKAAQLAEKLVEGCYTYLAALGIITSERVLELAPEIEPGQLVPLGRVYTKSGGEIMFHFEHYLEYGKNDDTINNELERVWFSGSLIRMGDELAQYNYFDRAPELELIRHLRNGVAHGNRFNITHSASLTKFPAHNRDAWIKDPKMLFEIQEQLNGQAVLFDFMAPGDIIQLLQAVSAYLINMGRGEPLRP